MKFKVGDKVSPKLSNYHYGTILSSNIFKSTIQIFDTETEVIDNHDYKLYKTPHDRLVELGWVALSASNVVLTYLLNVDGCLHLERIELSHEGKSFYTTLRVIDLEHAEILVDYLKELRDESPNI